MSSVFIDNQGDILHMLGAEPPRHLCCCYLRRAMILAIAAIFMGSSCWWSFFLGSRCAAKMGVREGVTHQYISF
ncbi:hypothetical protein QTG54_000294 [Skeletonema marinoi]|uniref:Uncharacterized protein n=1 Tax=Skeletonema marinoi TaxID=267567 RepID=A0AAD8YN59_9STRA|nr:hypothetical protein QTG54_000294 [Skeletonema marinoi]